MNRIAPKENYTTRMLGIRRLNKVMVRSLLLIVAYAGHALFRHGTLSCRPASFHGICGHGQRRIHLLVAPSLCFSKHGPVAGPGFHSKCRPFLPVFIVTRHVCAVPAGGVFRRTATGRNPTRPPASISVRSPAPGRGGQQNRARAAEVSFRRRTLDPAASPSCPPVRPNRRSAPASCFL